MIEKGISILLPCYNPPPDWVEIVRRNVLEIKGNIPHSNFEVIIIDDGSNPSIYDVNTSSRINGEIIVIQLQNDENRGKGYSLRKAVEAAKYEVLIFTDIDFPYTIESFIQVLSPVLEDKVDIQIAVKSNQYNARSPIVRRWISKILKKLVQLFLKVPHADTQCGLKAFNRKLVPILLSTKVDRFLFDLEFLSKVGRRNDLRFGVHPANLRNGVVFTKVKLKVLVTELINFLIIMMNRN